MHLGIVNHVLNEPRFESSASPQVTVELSKWLQSTRFLVVGAFALALGCGGPPPPRNVLLIVLDTLRADHLGVYGYERLTSPHLDRWAEDAVVFERAFSTSSWTLPAFGSMLTGLPQSAHGGGLQVPGAEAFYEVTPIDGTVVTLAQRLRRHGLATVGFVSNPFLKPRSGMRRGFDTYRFCKPELGADCVVELALESIQELGSEPFFMLLSFMEPHWPYVPPVPFRGRFTGDENLREIESLKVLRAQGAEYPESDRQHYIGRYDEEIATLDDRLSYLFEGLGERWADTLVVVTSDHGEELFDHDSFDHGHTMMQELLHVPMIVWAPGLEPRRIDVPVSLADVAPTVLDALGFDARESGSPGAGRSLWRLASEGEPLEDRDLLAEGLLFGVDRKALIRWPYKLVYYEDGTRRLVDLVADPGESRDLASELPELADRMEETLREHVADADDWSAVPAVEMDTETARQIEALGYVN